ncbi:efflux RND transporter periplasmic adaptor subunit [Paractinoplanes atraurantiacus]|uniref:RND family efflux transporter, MFP subunit n=1 Tax=Paractinoplanes atraurantiacus TaxID=1036182 RepID=A0A285HYJ0_9ACTN|nr:efflux RND transporter periplasmic adaptor subunit [Actinoplanes atraurantiacus]SNY40703.1 RND family efflux transporter, MFP subunit [Actinoplanes atraurantiacus]
MTRSRPLVIAAAMIFLVSSTAASCGDDKSGVGLGQATRGTVAEIVEAPGSVTARAAATVSAPASGTLAELRAEPGQRVAKDQVVAVIDSPELEARRRSAEKALDQSSGGSVTVGDSTAFLAVRHQTDTNAEKAYQEARAAAAQITDPALRETLLKQVDAARRQYNLASAAAAAALRSVQEGVASLGEAVNSLSSAQRLQAQQAYDLADAAVSALTLRAPVAGVVQLGGVATGGSSLTDLLSAGGAGAASSSGSAGGALPGVDEAVPQGAFVAAGTPILTVVDVSRLGLTAEVDETDVLLVKAGTPATVELDAASGASYDAKVRSIDLLPTTSARGGVSYKVRLDLTASADAPAPRPGMSAVVRLQVREADDTVTVPASAVISVDGKDTVWAVEGDRYERVPVTLGVQGEDVVEITEGLKAGQRIAVSGADEIQPGDKAP